MKAARIIVLVVALAAGGAAAFLVAGDEEKKPVAEAPAPAPQMSTIDVLIAQRDIGMGTSIAAQDLQWQAWPAATTGESYITKKDRPSAVEEINGAITRAASSVS